MTRVAVVTAGLGQPSSTRILADQLAAAVADEVALRAGQAPHIEVVELRDLARGITNNMLTGFPDPELRRALETVTGADALIAVTPIFSASYSGLFKSFFDIVEPAALAGKPVLIAATAGSARHSLALEHALRPLFSYLRARVEPTAVFAASEDFGPGARRELAERIGRAAAELAADLVGAPGQRPDEGADEVVDFETLLHGRG